jgi:hypothetical protein
MDSLEHELRALLLKKTEPKYLAQLYLLLDSVRELADTIEAEIEESDDVSSSDSDSDGSDSESSDSDSDASFTKEERKLIRSPEQYAFLKRYSLVPK